MIKNTVKWRKEFGIEALLEEDLGNDKEGHPVCYNVYGAFQDKELYQNCFADEEKHRKFLRWRIQFLEKSIRKLDFSPTGICTIVQVNDFKNSPGPAKRELRQATKQAVHILQDDYPEFVAKQIFINVPWWYLAFNKMISPSRGPRASLCLLGHPNLLKPCSNTSHPNKCQFNTVDWAGRGSKNSPYPTLSQRSQSSLRQSTLLIFPYQRSALWFGNSELWVGMLPMEQNSFRAMRKVTPLLSRRPGRLLPLMSLLSATPIKLVNLAR